MDNSEKILQHYQDLNKIARDLVLYPNKQLLISAAEVTPQEIPLLKSVTDMFFLLIDDINAVGLAAPQVGIGKRFFVLDDRQGTRLTCFNPRFIKTLSDTCTTADEGCLSLPNQFLPVERCTEIEVAWLEADGSETLTKLNGLAARIFQHELDHLNGTLILDYQSRVRRDIIQRKMVRLQKRLR